MVAFENISLPRRHRSLYPIILCFIILLAVPGKALACSCAGMNFDMMKLYVGDAVEIFEGKLVSVEIIARRNSNLGMGPNWLFTFGLYKFHIDRSYKGRPKGEILVGSGLGGGDCGVLFEVGVRYLVLADPDSLGWYRPYLVTTDCNGTGRLDDSALQLAFLRGEIRSKEKWQRLDQELQGPPADAAYISGDVRGLEGKHSFFVETLRADEDNTVHYRSDWLPREGKYQIAVSGGTYFLRAVNWPLADPFRIGYYKSGTNMEQATAISVVSGQRLSGIDFDVSVPQTYNLTGSIRTPLWPYVPPTGLKVMLRDRDYRSLRPERSANCRSDGTFEINDVYPGRYHLEAGFWFEESDPDREWRADIPVIEVPQQTNGVVIQIRATGSWIPWAVRRSSLRTKVLLGLLALSLVSLALIVRRKISKSR